jgi:hypothetical protein
LCMHTAYVSMYAACVYGCVLSVLCVVCVCVVCAYMCMYAPGKGGKARTLNPTPYTLKQECMLRAELERLAKLPAQSQFAQHRCYL